MGLFDQWNTKTLGGTNKLSKSDFDLIQDGVHVQETNKDALELVNLVGQATNTQSQSGGIPGTAKLIELDETSAGPFPFFIPEEGECWQCIGAATGTVVNSTAILLLTNGSELLELGQETAVNDTFSPTFGADIVIDSNVYLTMLFSGNSAPGSKALAAFIRVR